MLSVVLYGRNDNYGYNLHKRASLAINCLAELLTDGSDEILFVDYNTPDDFPTFPEAIADTLTPRAVARLRVLRARSSIHDRVKARTHLKAIEPIARNVAIRRSNPANRWILSTNTDMIFVPRGADSLSAIAADLRPGYYHLPRFELPESLWESFDRMDPASVIAQVRRLGRTMFLNEIVYGAECIKYDAPGDFQLMLRDDLFRIRGFDEEMLLGWHVDSNIAKRLFLIYGRVGDVVDRLFGYHCDHTRQVTPMHQHAAPSNDTYRFVEDVAHPELPQQAESWGCARDDIEEISLRRTVSRIYGEALSDVLHGEWPEPTTTAYTPESFGATTYDPRHVLPFLADLFVSCPRQWTLGWIGARPDTFEMFCDVWRRFGFRNPILVDAWAAPLLSPAGSHVRIVPRSEVSLAADAFVFDFGSPSDAPESRVRLPVDPVRLDQASDDLLRESFRELVAAERGRLRAGETPRRFVCVDAVHNKYQWIAQREIGAASTPFAARLRHGFVKLHSLQDLWRGEELDLLPRMRIGAAGVRTEEGVAALPGRRGYLVTGPAEELPAGGYEVTFSFRSSGPLVIGGLLRRVVLEVVVGSRLVAQVGVNPLAGNVTVPFTLSETCPEDFGSVEFRIFRGRFVQFLLTGIRLRQVTPPPHHHARASDPEQLLRMLDLAPQPMAAARTSRMPSRPTASETA